MKKNFGLIMTICAIVFCVLNLVGFFIPTAVHKEDTSVKLSSMEIAFTSKKTAEKKVEELTKELTTNSVGNSKKAEDTAKKIAKYSILASLKTEKDTKNDANFGAIMHFISCIASTALAVVLLVGLFKGNLTLAGRIIAICAFVLALCSMIGYLCLFNSSISMGIAKVKVSKLFKVNAGMILSLIATALTVPAVFLPYKKKA